MTPTTNFGGVMSRNLESERDRATSIPTVAAQTSVADVEPLLATRRVALGLTAAATAGLLADRAVSPEPALAAESGEPINIKNYGATGNAVTDDTTAIQAALKAAAEKAVIIPTGTYKTTS